MEEQEERLHYGRHEKHEPQQLISHLNNPQTHITQRKDGEYVERESARVRVEEEGEEKKEL